MLESAWTQRICLSRCVAVAREEQADLGFRRIHREPEESSGLLWTLKARLNKRARRLLLCFEVGPLQGARVDFVVERLIPEQCQQTGPPEADRIFNSAITVASIGESQ